MNAAGEDDETLRLIARCGAGDAAAARRFQELYGELVYGYPLRVYRTPADEAGDFYVFAFDGGRLFRRLRTFEGRVPLRAYLLGFVLDDLVLEWRRGQRSVDTVSLDDVGEIGSETCLQPPDAAEALALGRLLSDLEPGKSVVFKLLHAEDYDLSADELRHLAVASRRSLASAITAVEELRRRIRERETAAREVEDNLDSVQAWIQLYERRVARIGDDLESLPPRATRAQRLREERDELERKLGKRRQQRDKLADQVRRRKVTAPYKEIAAVLNTSVGNVGSQIARLRDELARRGGGSSELHRRKDSNDGPSTGLQH